MNHSPAGIIDIHSHIFPDAIAQKATDSVSDFYGMKAARCGTLDALLKDYDEAGISMGCIHSVAITPHSVAAINQFISASVKAHPDRLAGYAAIHPDCGDIEALTESALALGLKGYKIHPDMQHFALDEPKAMEMFAAIEGKMPIIIHTGDHRFEYSRPRQMKKVLDAFPNLTCVCAHLGGWSEWDDACRMLAKYENAYVDTSSSLYMLAPEKAKKIIRSYNRERVLFGIDFPMWTAKTELERFLNLRLTEEEQDLILRKNAMSLPRFTD